MPTFRILEDKRVLTKKNKKKYQWRRIKTPRMWYFGSQQKLFQNWKNKATMEVKCYYVAE